MAQELRLSQFVITYGPGAILEGPQGPRVIPRAEIGLFQQGATIRPERFEISDQRMSLGLLSGARIFRLPSNAELRIPPRQPIYRTRQFPMWSVCQNHTSHAGGVQILYQGNQCPECGSQGQRRLEAVRFIRACPDGHLDDVDWPTVVHRGAPPCGQNRSFRWHGGGGALTEVELECPGCGRRANLGQAYTQIWGCSGRLPEQEALIGPAIRPRCNRGSRIIQRQASNLRIPELRTLFTIPRRSTRLHTLLGQTAVYSALVVTGLDGLTSPDQLRQSLERLRQSGLLTQPTLDEIMGHPWTEIRQAIEDVLAPIPGSFHELLVEEFRALCTASYHGHPPVHGPTPSSPVWFEVNPRFVVRVDGPNGTAFRVTPITRLRTVTVQTGYRREIPLPQQAGGQPVPAQVVDVGMRDTQRNQNWYPGIDFLGEGIFISLEGEERYHQLVGNSAAEWRRAFDAGAAMDYPLYLFRTGMPEELHPVFIWWHALSHLLMRAIAVDAGYSSAAIRERVYLDIDSIGRARGGIILYATQPGNEGTLGGLIALAPHFRAVISRACDMLQACSNDPLCLENRFTAGTYCGSACYGCLLISETSCEHRNLWLDRHVLLENTP